MDRLPRGRADAGGVVVDKGTDVKRARQERGRHLADPVDEEHILHGPPTTEASAVVAPIHAKAMPVILTTNEEMDVWLRTPWGEASALLRPLAENASRTVARAEKEEGAEPAAGLAP